METGELDLKALVASLRSAIGPVYDPKDQVQAARMLAEGIRSLEPRYERDEIPEAVRAVLRTWRSKLDWETALERILCRLPGVWVKLTNSPGFNASTMLLLTDGTVMVQEEGGLRWKRLRPDATGSYVHGTWTDLAPMHHTRRYFASAVLRDGRVFVCGGEYSDAGSDTNKTEIYDPATDVWTEIDPPPGWTSVGDAPSTVLPDGRVLLGHLNDSRTAIYDPASNTWTAGPNKGSSSSEESWALMPDDTVITVRCDGSMKSDKYVDALREWVDGGTLPVNIIEVASSEIGAAVALPDGRAFFAGATNKTALYSMPLNPSDPGIWNAGPEFPDDGSGQTVGCKDSPSCLLTNGKVLIAAGPVDGQSWLAPTLFHELSGSSLGRVNDPPNATKFPYIGRMLLLPTGQVLFAAQTNEIYAYTYFSCPDPAWRPVITSAPAEVRPYHTYMLQGRNLNGLSQAVGYGDDAQAATNYPLVRIRNLASGQVRYCKTFDHSTMAVATGASIQSTTFAVPFGVEEGPSELCVVANGISSACQPIFVGRFHLPWPFVEAYNILIGSLADGPLWVLGPHGPIPVDPWGPDVAREAAAARERVLQGFETLRKLGSEVSKERMKKAAAVPHAEDGDAEEG